MCSGGGATKVCTIFLSVCLLIHGCVSLIEEIILLCWGTDMGRYKKNERKGTKLKKMQRDEVGSRKK